MRILIAHSFYRIAGGEDRYVREQVELLRGSHEVELLARLNEELEPSPLLAVRMTFSPSEYAAVSRTIRRLRPDVIHLHNAYPALGPAVHLAARRYGIPIVMTVHNHRLRCPNGLMFTEGSPCQRCVGGAYWNSIAHECFPTRSQASAYALALSVHRLGFRLEKTIDCFVAPSQFMADRLLSWGIPSDRITIVRHFTSSHPTATPPGENGLYLGRLSAEKGVDVLLEGLAQAGDPPFEIAGSGPADNDLRRRAEGLGLANVRFLGQLDQGGVADALRRARYVVAPSLSDEILSLVALEALAAGRPLIGTATGGLEELVDRGGGIVIPPGDAAALAAAIGRYVVDDELVGAAAERGRAFAASAFTPPVHLAALEQMYAKVVGRGARTRPRPVAGTADLTRATVTPSTPPRPRNVARAGTPVALEDGDDLGRGQDLDELARAQLATAAEAWAVEPQGPGRRVTPDLSVCVPTFERPQFLARALASVVDQDGPGAHRIELLVSDNSPAVSRSVVEPFLARWAGPTRYLANDPSIGAIANFNQCLLEANGTWILFLHDDDYLLPDAMTSILGAIDHADGDRVLLFGVDVVDEHGRRRRRQSFNVVERLDPRRAFVRLMSDSSFVRIPSLVIRRDVFDEVGRFDETLGDPTDFELLTRVFARFGLRCEPRTTAAYSVHLGTATSEMFHEDTIATLMTIFGRARDLQVLPDSLMGRCEADFFHHFILGGAYRQLRAGQPRRAGAILDLFDLPEVSSLGASSRWRLIRWLFETIVRLPPGIAATAMRTIGRISPERFLSSW